VTTPGERFAYSNLGYGILGYLIERVSGRSYDELMQSEVFRPLGLSHTSVNMSSELERFQAARYRSDGLALPWYEADTPGASAVFSSALDLVHFGMFHLKEYLPGQQAFLSNMALDEMQAQSALYAPGRGYGLGWWTNDDIYGYRTISHAGSMDGASAALWFVPAERLAVAILANVESEVPFEIIDDIFAHLLPLYTARLEHEQTTALADQAVQPGITTSFVPSTELSGEWTGIVDTLHDVLPFTLWLHAVGDVYAQIGARTKEIVSAIQFSANRLRGEIDGPLDESGASRYAHHLRLDLTLRGTILDGVIVEITNLCERRGDKINGPSRSALSYWAELHASSPSPRKKPNGSTTTTLAPNTCCWGCLAKSPAWRRRSYWPSTWILLRCANVLFNW
jgi:hypothetical protein